MQRYQPPQCHICGVYTRDFDQWQRHVIVTHGNDANLIWQCVFPACPARKKQFPRYRPYKRHVSVYHAEENFAMFDVHFEEIDQEELVQRIDVPDDNGPHNQNEPENLVMAQENIQNVIQDNGNGVRPLNIVRAANVEGKMYDFTDGHDMDNFGKFILSIKERFGIPDLAIRGLVACMKEFDTERSIFLKEQLTEFIPHLEPQIHRFFNFYIDNNYRTWCNYEKRYHLDNYRRSLIKEGKLVIPIQVVIGQQVICKNGELIDKFHYGHYFPLAPLLKMLFSNIEYRHILTDQPVLSPPNVYRDFIDGSYWKSHPCNKHGTLPVLLSECYDELGVTSPLGARIHKVGTFYVSVSSLRPLQRSVLPSIHLLAVAESKHIKRYGYRKLLTDFKDVINCRSIQGLSVTNSGEEYVIHPVLFLGFGDMPGSNYVAGYKEGANAKYPCRGCKVSVENINHLHREDARLMRTKEEYVDTCQQLETCLDRQDRINLSRDTGINEKTVLSEVNTFDVSKCFVQDVMHLFLEGILKEDFAKLLYYLIYVLRCCSLLDINTFIKNLKMNNILEAPSQIMPEQLNNTLKQTSSQMYALTVIIPLLLDHLNVDVNDNGIVQNTLRIIRITQIFLSFELTESDLTYAEDEIESYLEWYVRNYCRHGRKLNIKRHAIIHLPNQVRKFGPTRFSWCMRFEALHQVLKEISRENNNFINLTSSLANRFAFHRLVESNFNDPDYHYITKKTVVTGSKLIDLNDLDPAIRESIVEDVTHVQSVSSASFMHKNIRVNQVWLVTVVRNNPVFGKVNKLIYVDTSDALHVLFEIGEILHYNYTAMAYKVEFGHGNNVCLPATELNHPLATYTYRRPTHSANETFVTLHSHTLHTYKQ